MADYIAVFESEGESLSGGFESIFAFSLSLERGESQSNGYSIDSILLNLKKGWDTSRGFTLEDLIAGESTQFAVERGESNSFGFKLDIEYNGNIINSLERGESSSQGIETGFLESETVRLVLEEAGSSNSFGYNMRVLINLIENIEYGDTIFLMINGAYGFKVFRGAIRDISPSDRFVEIEAITGDGILAERRIKENWGPQDIGVIAKDIIDKYCQPLASEYINTETGIVAPVPGYMKTPLKVFEQMATNYEIIFFVDNEWGFHFFLREELTTGDYLIQLGDE